MANNKKCYIKFTDGEDVWYVPKGGDPTWDDPPEGADIRKSTYNAYREAVDKDWWYVSPCGESTWGKPNQWAEIIYHDKPEENKPEENEPKTNESNTAKPDTNNTGREHGNGNGKGIVKGETPTGNTTRRKGIRNYLFTKRVGNGKYIFRAGKTEKELQEIQEHYTGRIKKDLLEKILSDAQQTLDIFRGGLFKRLISYMIMTLQGVAYSVIIAAAATWIWTMTAWPPSIGIYITIYLLFGAINERRPHGGGDSYTEAVSNAMRGGNPDLYTKAVANARNNYTKKQAFYRLSITRSGFDTSSIKKIKDLIISRVREILVLLEEHDIDKQDKQYSNIVEQTNKDFKEVSKDAYIAKIIGTLNKVNIARSIHEDSSIAERHLKNAKHTLKNATNKDIFGPPRTWMKLKKLIENNSASINDLIKKENNTESRPDNDSNLISKLNMQVHSLSTNIQLLEGRKNLIESMVARRDWIQSREGNNTQREKLATKTYHILHYNLREYTNNSSTYKWFATKKDKEALIDEIIKQWGKEKNEINDIINTLEKNNSYIKNINNKITVLNEQLTHSEKALNDAAALPRPRGRGKNTRRNR